MTEKTRPVYIDETRKNKVKARAAEEGVSMKEVIQRLVDHGFALGLHQVPTDGEVDLENVDVPFELDDDVEVTEL